MGGLCHQKEQEGEEEDRNNETLLTGRRERKGTGTMKPCSQV